MYFVLCLTITKELSYIFRISTIFQALRAGATTETCNFPPGEREEGDVERFDAVIMSAGAAGMFCAPRRQEQAGSRVRSSIMAEAGT